MQTQTNQTNQTQTRTDAVQEAYQTLLAARLFVASAVQDYLAGRIERAELAAYSAAETQAHEVWAAYCRAALTGVQS